MFIFFAYIISQNFWSNRRLNPFCAEDLIRWPFWRKPGRLRPSEKLVLAEKHVSRKKRKLSRTNPSHNTYRSVSGRMCRHCLLAGNYKGTLPCLPSPTGTSTTTSINPTRKGSILGKKSFAHVKALCLSAMRLLLWRVGTAINRTNAAARCVLTASTAGVFAKWASVNLPSRRQHLAFIALLMSWFQTCWGSLPLECF